MSDIQANITLTASVELPGQSPIEHLIICTLAISNVFPLKEQIRLATSFKYLQDCVELPLFERVRHLNACSTSGRQRHVS